jgi:hypothetical protein
MRTNLPPFPTSHHKLLQRLCSDVLHSGMPNSHAAAAALQVVAGMQHHWCDPDDALGSSYVATSTVANMHTLAPGVSLQLVQVADAAGATCYGIQLVVQGMATPLWLTVVAWDHNRFAGYSGQVWHVFQLLAAQPTLLSSLLAWSSAQCTATRARMHDTGTPAHAAAVASSELYTTTTDNVVAMLLAAQA